MDKTPRGIGALGLAGLAIGALPYLFSLFFLLTFQRQTPEDGMIVGFVMLGQIALWLGLGLFLWAALAAARPERPVILGAASIFPFCAYASVQSFQLMGTNPNWLSVVPALLPLLVLGFGFRLVRTPRNEAKRPALMFGAAAIILLTVFAFGPWRSDPAAGIAGYAGEQARSEAEFLLRLRLVSRTDDLLEYLNQDDRRTLALEAIGRLPSRQDDVARMLNEGRALGDRMELHAFNLEATPGLCSAYRTAFNHMIDRIASHSWEVTPSHLEDQFTNLAWLMRGGCDLAPQLRRAAVIVRQLEDRPGDLADRLDEMADATASATGAGVRNSR